MNCFGESTIELCFFLVEIFICYINYKKLVVPKKTNALETESII